jgi:hypothetical protein
MADMPPKGAPAPEGEAPDVGDAVAQVGAALEALAQQAPEFGEVAEHFRAVFEQGAGGAQPAPEGAMTAEQGGNPGARPMSMGG